MTRNYLYHFVFHCTVLFCIASYHFASYRIVCYRWLFHMSLKCMVSLSVYRDAYCITSVLKMHIPNEYATFSYTCKIKAPKPLKEKIIVWLRKTECKTETSEALGLSDVVVLLRLCLFHYFLPNFCALVNEMIFVYFSCV